MEFDSEVARFFKYAFANHSENLGSDFRAFAHLDYRQMDNKMKCVFFYNGSNKSFGIEYIQLTNGSPDEPSASIEVERDISPKKIMEIVDSLLEMGGRIRMPNPDEDDLFWLSKNDFFWIIRRMKCPSHFQMI